MRENRLDRITDKLKLRVGRVLVNAHKQFKGTNPYRMERIPDEERLHDYAQLTEDDMNFARQEFGDEGVDNYLSEIDDLMRRRNA